MKPNNTGIFEEILRLRQKYANQFGETCYSRKILKSRMAKTPEHVQDFLEKLANKIHKKGRMELMRVIIFKNRLGYTHPLRTWDVGYFAKKFVRSQFHISVNKLKHHFPVDKVLNGTMTIYENLLGLKIVKTNLPVWHKDVTAYKVYDKKSEEYLGTFYLDLFPRDGKFSHAATFTLQERVNTTGFQKRIKTAMVVNFPKELKGTTYMTHSAVTTFFHEFGHVMHDICVEVNYPGQRSTPRDFVEMPSQMNENWSWDETVLRMIS